MIADFPQRLIVPAGMMALESLNTIRALIGLPPQPALESIDPAAVTEYGQLEDVPNAEAERTLSRLREVDRHFRAGLVWRGGIADLDRRLARDLKAHLLAK